MVVLVALLAQALVHAPYRLVPFDQVLRHRKACVEGRVVYVRQQADGDVHITLTDQAHRVIVAEIIPELPLPAPRKGQRILACGISSHDPKHRLPGETVGWPELHPLVGWRAK